MYSIRISVQPEGMLSPE